jgi:multidrug resistance efflux pump
MQGIKTIIEREMNGKSSFRSFEHVYQANRQSKVRYWAWGILFMLLVFLLLPWTQNIRARGRVTTLRQEQRPQALQTIIPGRIIQWYVKEGDFVRKGDTLIQLAEVKDEYLDPNLLARTNDQLSAKRNTVESYRNKLSSVDQQLKTLELAQVLKLKEITNKISQQQQKIQSDSMEWLAAQNDFSIKSDQLKRQKALYDSGLVSLLQLEQRNQAYQDALAKKTSAGIKFNVAKQELSRLHLEWNGAQQEYLEKISKTDADRYQVISQIATGEGEIAKLQNQYMNYSVRSGQYFLLAPQDGQLINAQRQGINELVKEGERLAEIVPKDLELAVELFVKPVDLPLVDTGQSVRFLFDGFPAIVFSGWPQASYGIFSGKVVAVETAVRENGLFRILVIEDPTEKKWPKELRNGTGASGIALLKNVPVWYELWRNINGFPPDYYTSQSSGSSQSKKKS